MRRLIKTHRILSVVISFAIPILVIFWSEPCRAYDKAAAKVEFERAVVLFADADYSGALEAFLESYRIYPRVSTLFNIGSCQKALLLYAEAIETFERFLGNEASKENPKLRQHAETDLLALSELVGELHLKKIPADLTLSVDGKPIDEKKIGSPIRLNPGHHSIVITKDGYKEFRADVTATPSIKTELDVVLEPIVQEPPDAPTPKESEPAREGEQPDESEGEGKWSPLKKSGVVMGVFGFGGIGAGVVSSILYNKYYDEGMEYKDELENDPDQNTLDSYNKLANEKQPAARTGMIIGYVIGGTFVAASVTMILLDMARNKREAEPAVSIAPSGISVQF